MKLSIHCDPGGERVQRRAEAAGQEQDVRDGRGEAGRKEAQANGESEKKVKQKSENQVMKRTSNFLGNLLTSRPGRQRPLEAAIWP
jgi:hypothetical protein